MSIVADIFLVFAVARLCGAAAHRLGVPAEVGELTGGVFIALVAVPLLPGLEGLASAVHIEALSQAGIFALLLLVGVELRPQDLRRHLVHGLWIASAGAALPMLLGGAVVLAMLDVPGPLSGLVVFAAVMLAITDVPASARVLEEQGVLDTPLGQTVISAAIFDDVIGLVLLAVAASLAATNVLPGADALALQGLGVAVFFAATIVAGVHVYPHVTCRVRALELATLELSVLIGVALGYAWLAELLGLHWVLGPMMAGLFFEPGRVGDKAYNEVRLAVSAITNGFLGTMFFAAIGLSISLAALLAAPWLAALLFAAAVIGKLVGAGVPARLAGLSRREATATGIAMVPRGAVGFVVLGVGEELGVFANLPGAVGEELFSALIVTAVATTLAAPLLLRAYLTRSP